MFEEWRYGSYIVKAQLEQKLKDYKEKELQEIMEKISNRRKKELEKELTALEDQQKKLAARLQAQKKTGRVPASFRSQILEGPAEDSFNSSFHFQYSFQKERQWAQQSELREATCSICIQQLQEKCLMTLSFSCEHAFHTSCLQNWFKTKGSSPNCPMCRAKIKKSDSIVRELQHEITDNKIKILKVKERQAYLINKFEEILLKRSK